MPVRPVEWTQEMRDAQAARTRERWKTDSNLRERQARGSSAKNNKLNIGAPYKDSKAYQHAYYERRKLDDPSFLASRREQARLYRKQTKT